MILKKKPLVTIYIVSKNHSKFLAKSIKSVLSQSYKNLEIFFVDDNSQMEALKKLKNLRKRK